MFGQPKEEKKKPVAQKNKLDKRYRGIVGFIENNYVGNTAYDSKMEKYLRKKKVKKDRYKLRFQKDNYLLTKNGKVTPIHVYIEDGFEEEGIKILNELKLK